MTVTKQKLAKEDWYRARIRSAVNDFTEQYKNYMQNAIDDVFNTMKQGYDIPQAVEIVTSRKGFVNDRLKELIEDVLTTVVEAVNGKTLSKGKMQRIVSRAVNESWTDDGVSLKKRIRRLSNDTIYEIRRSTMATVGNLNQIDMKIKNIEKLVLQTDVDIRKVKDQCRALRTVAGLATHGNRNVSKDLYQQIERLIRALNGDSVRARTLAMKNLKYTASQVWEYALPNTLQIAFKGKAAYRAERIARTEASKLYFESFIAQHQSNPDVVAYQWSLSPRHNIFDQCDVCANINIGYGRGIYPKNLMPSIPRHPHCMCTINPVYRVSIKRKHRVDINMARKYFSGLSERHLQDLFGIAGAVDVSLGGDWQKYLRGWNGFSKPKTRFEFEDFN